MAIRSRLNQYQGINAHFQSYVQSERDGWSTFHTLHISHLTEIIGNALPPGYEISTDRSLQIRVTDPDTGRSKRYAPEPDLTIWDTALTAPRHPLPQPNTAIATPTVTKSLMETLLLDQAKRLEAVLIKQLSPDGTESLPVTQIELLSPTNKVSPNREQYRAKRDVTLVAGTALIEIDYLHETDSPIRGIPSYASGAADSYPYTIAISDPRPSLEQGQMMIYGFRADELMLPISIPLAGRECMIVDFGAIYRRTFEGLPTFSNRANYAKEPVNFQRYQQVDQRLIWARMLAVIEAERTGHDLEQGIFPALTNDAALDWFANNPYQQANLLVDEEKLTVYWLVQMPDAAKRDQHQLTVLYRTENMQTHTFEVRSELITTGQAEEIAATYAVLKSIFDEKGVPAFKRAIRTAKKQ